MDECKDGQQHCDPVRGICQNEDIFKTNKRFNCTCPNGWELSTDGSNICKGQLSDDFYLLYLQYKT